MQAKPRFESYKIIERHPILTDDTGNEFALTLFEVLLPSPSNELMMSTYRFYTVVGKNQVTWNNRSVSYESNAYWKDKKRTLIKTEVNGILVEEIEYGDHYVFCSNMTPKPEDFGLSTTFKLSIKNAK